MTDLEIFIENMKNIYEQIKGMEEIDSMYMTCVHYAIMTAEEFNNNLKGSKDD